jgi:single-stranded-DNA-specific exonuclease
MEMMQWIQKESVGKGIESENGILIKFGGHKQAGGMNLKIANLPILEELIQKYGINIKPSQTKKTINVDTLIHPHERNAETLTPLDQMEPFGKQNEEPLFVLQNTIIKSVEKVGARGKGHLKISVNHG